MSEEPASSETDMPPAAIPLEQCVYFMHSRVPHVHHCAFRTGMQCGRDIDNWRDCPRLKPLIGETDTETLMRCQMAAMQVAAPGTFAYEAQVVFEVIRQFLKAETRRLYVTEGDLYYYNFNTTKYKKAQDGEHNVYARLKVHVVARLLQECSEFNDTGVHFKRELGL